MNLNYEKENKMLSPTLRQYVGMANRVTKEIQRYYLRLFEGNTQQALRNNYNAQQIACGFDMSIHFQNLMSAGADMHVLDI